MMKKLLTIALAALALTGSASAHEVADTTTCPNAGRLMLCLHNHVRSHFGLLPLRWQNPDGTRSILYDSARLKRDKIVACGVFSHTPCGIGAFDYFIQVGYPWPSTAGENLAYGTSCLDRCIFNLWLHSSGHRANILNGNFREFGSAHGSYPGFPNLWATNFGARSVLGAGAWSVYYRFGLKGAPDDGLLPLTNAERIGYGILAIKRELIERGYFKGIVLTTTFGNAVRDRTVDFQRAQGVTADGVVGPTTARVLFRKRKLSVGAARNLGDAPCKVITLESGNDPGAQGWVDDADRGLGQINRRAHPDVTDRQAYTPSFSVPWVGDYLAAALSRFKDIAVAIASYNGGFGGAADWQAAGKPTDSILGHYVELVLAQPC